MSEQHDQEMPDRAARRDQIVGQFEDAWSRHEQPQISEYLSGSGAERLDLLRELVHVDLEWRLKAGQDVRVETYLEDFSELGDDPAYLLELISAEFVQRRRRDPSLTVDEYLQRFPEHRDELAKRLTEEPLPSRRRRFPIRLNCPHCQNPIAVVDDTTDEEVRCPSCGSSFRLDHGRSVSWRPEKLPNIGKFELLEVAGRGAFGTVYRARDTELDRIVAVKVPRSGLFSGPEDEVRFVREARSVAQLHHPGIVPVYDVGRSEVGRGELIPYIVSQYVEGITVADALTGRRFSFRESAQIIVQVADALEHSHQHGVVHRDLKPSNMMLQDTKQLRVLLMDFGLARRDVGEITVTVKGAVMGTPAYMSPELARGEGHLVDGRSDIYSLGVILYQLLVGELPFRGNRRMLLHQVVNSDPQPPRKLNDRIPRDLETICLKCLEKSPDKRYASAKELGDELRRFQAGETIKARPVGRLARFSRWSKRNPVVASLAATAAGLLLAVAVVAMLGYVQTSRALRAKDAAAATSEQVSQFLTNLFVSSDPLQLVMSGERALTTPNPADLDRTAKDLLERGAQRIRTELTDQPAVRAELLDTIGTVYTGLGEYEESCQLLREAIEIRETQLPRDLKALSRTKHNLGIAKHFAGEYDISLQYLSQALEERLKVFGEKSVETTATMGALGLAYVSRGDEKKAEELLARSVDIRKQMFAPNDPRLAMSLSQYAAMLLASNREEEAMKNVEEVLIIASANQNGGDWAQASRIVADFQGGKAALNLGSEEEAVKLLHRAAANAEALLGESHPFVAFGLFEYGQALEAIGEYEQAIEKFQRAIQVCDQTLSDKHPKVLIARHGLSSCYYQQDKYERSLEILDELLPDVEEVCGKSSHEYANLSRDKSLVLSDLGRHEEAIALGLESMKCAREVAEHPTINLDDFAFKIALCYKQAGDHESAAAFLQNFIEEYDKPVDLGTKRLLVRELIEVGKFDEAAAVIADGEQTPDISFEWKQRLRLLEAERLLAMGVTEEAEQIARDAHTTTRAVKGNDNSVMEAAVELLERIASENEAANQSNISDPAIDE